MGGGSLWDVGCYPISYARMLVGEEPVEVSGWQVTGRAEAMIPSLGRCVSRMESMRNSIAGSHLHSRSYIEIVGSDAVSEHPHPVQAWRKKRITLTRGDTVETIKIKGQELYLGEVEDMCDAILLGKPSRISLADSRGNIAAILSCSFRRKMGKTSLFRRFV
jgi:D-xylose 1-dehydrogenase (NADP+, D-xylono-1,5-lactone-forming)